MSRNSPSTSELGALLNSLTPREREELDRLLRVSVRREIPFCPHTPSPKQAEFLALKCPEALYGGAAGGGKSDALLMAALQFVEVPGYAALLLRRTYADLSLPGALMDRAGEWLRGRARWDDRRKTWRFPSGATLTFGYLETETDKYRYQGSEFQFVGFDELTQFTETQYRYLFSRTRRLAGVALPLRVRAASNPGGVGHEWVRSRFIEADDPERVFVPARLADNPYLDQEAYRQALAALDPVTRQQLLAGDWDIRPEGRLFKREWFRILDAKPAGLRWVRAWDLAATEDGGDWTAGALLGWCPKEYYYCLADMARVRASPRGVEQVIAQTAKADGVSVAIVIEQEPGSSGVALVDRYVREVLKGYAVRGVRSTGDKVTRANPVSAQAEAGNVRLVAGPWVGAFRDEAAPFPSVGVADDQIDALSGAFRALNTGHAAPVAVARSRG